MIVAQVLKNAKKEELKSKVAKLHKDKYSLDGKIERLNLRITGLYSDYKDNVISLNEYNDMKRHFAKQKEDCAKHKETIDNHIYSIENDDIIFPEGVQKLIDCKGICEINRQVLASLIDSIAIDSEKKVTINFKFTDEIRKYADF